MSEDKHFRRALVPGLGISALLIGVGFWQSITMGIVCLVGCGALLAIFCLYTRNQTREASCPFWRITFTKPPASCKLRRN